MPFPTFEQVLKELLVFTREATKKSSSYNTERAIRNLATHFNLSEEEKEAEYEGGKLFRSLVTHARDHLKGAGLLQGTSKSFDITSEGRLLIRKKTAVIDEKVLAQYGDYKLFLKEIANDSKINAQWYKDNGILTPNKMFAALKKAISDSNSVDSISEFDELEVLMKAKLMLQKRKIEREMNRLYEEHISELKESLLEKVKQISPSLFEKLCVELITKLVYEGIKPPANLREQIKTVGKSGDGGIDGIITKKDKIQGELKYYIQAKRWKSTTVGEPEIRNFVGSLVKQEAKNGIFITTSGFTKAAEIYASDLNNYKVWLIDGNKFVQHMIDLEIGIQSISTYQLNTIDHEFFEEKYISKARIW